MTSKLNKTKAAFWRVRQTRLVLDNPWAKVRCDSCELPDGTLIDEYYYWEGANSVEVFALTPRDEVVLTRQYKHGVKEVVVELPAGFIEGNDEAPLAAAQRELKEETGFASDDWLFLGQLNVSSTKSSARAYAFLARQSQCVFKQHLDATEHIDILLPDVDRMLRMIREGEIREANSIATTLLALQVIGYHGRC